MTRLTASLLPILLASITAFGGDSKERPLKVFVLAGTSNMLGAPAKLDKLPEDLREPMKDVLVYQKGEWVPLEAGKTLVGNEATFGRAMAKHLGEPVGILWISVASTSGKSPGSGISNMVKQSRVKGRPIVIAGMLLDVSYRDGINEDTAKAYGENLVRWVEAARKDFGNENLPIVMNRAIPPGKGTPYLDVVRKAQDAAKIPNFRVFNCDDVPRGGDKVHFQTEGRLEMGKRFAAGMIELMKSATSTQENKKPVRAQVKIAVFTGGIDADLKALRTTLAKFQSLKFDANDVKFGDFKRDGGLFVQPIDVQFTDLGKTDVGEVAKAVAEAKLSKNDGGLYLFMRYQPKSIDTKQLRAALGKVKGVTAEKSWAGDANIWLHVDATGHGKLAEITRTLHGAGVKFRDPITDIEP